jgi:hypothetical protein
VKLLIDQLRKIHRWEYAKRATFALWRIRFKRESRLRLISLRFRLAQWTRSPFRAKPSFLIGPTNSANQGTLWARALVRSGFSAESLRISTDPAAEWFGTDLSLTRNEWGEFSRRQALADHVAATDDVILIESLRPIFRLLNARDGRNPIIEDIELLKLMGKRVGVVFHGSDIRDTAKHSARNPYSPFHQESPELEKLRSRTAENLALIPYLRAEKIPLFVTTKDLLLDLPEAHFLPITIDFDRFHKVAMESPIFPDPSRKLRVLFLPSRSWLKSAELIEPVLIKLRDEGVIEYHSFLAAGESLKHSEVADAMAQVDLVIDQYLGVIGVFPVEALAAGRLVMSYLPPEVGEVPIINITPETLESELRRVAASRPHPLAGIEYAKQWHDGRESVLALAEVFGFRV